jgi:hypothetical protein
MTLKRISDAHACTVRVRAQENVYAAGSKFESFKKVASDMGVVATTSATSSASFTPVRQLQLACFHSVSKGYLGE